MTVQTTDNKERYTCSGAIDYPFTHYFFADTDLLVTRIAADGTATSLALTTDYTIAGAGALAGGTVTTLATYTDGELIIERIVSVIQDLDLVNNDGFDAETLEKALDRSTMIDQQLEEEVGRCLRLPSTSTASGGLPEAEANKFLKWSADGSELILSSGVVDFSGAASLESITLTSGQTSVAFANEIALGAFFVTGLDTDNGRLLEGTDYTASFPTNTISLLSSYPAGTILTMAYTDLEVSQLNTYAPTTYASLALLRGAYTTTGAVAYLSEDGRAGTFKWDSSDLTTEVAADTQSGIYVAPSSDLTGASGAWVRQYSGVVNVKWFGAVGDGITPDHVSINAALKYSLAVYFPTGVYFCDDTYSSAVGLEMQSGQYVYGDGESSIILQGTQRFLLAAGLADGGTPDPANNTKDLTIRDLVFKNVTGTFNEQQHLIMLSAVTNVDIYNCKFVGPRGDAIYLGSGISTPTAERHNQNINIHDCIFDGVNNENRNGISIIDGDGVHIDNCKFINMTKSTMPGCIDYEPNEAADFAIGRNISITNCVAVSCKGAAFFSYYTRTVQTPLKNTPSNIVVSNNSIDSACVFEGVGIQFTTLEPIDDSYPFMNIQITNNLFRGATNGVVYVRGVRGCIISGNTFDSVSGPLQIGDRGSITDGFAYDVVFKDNTLKDMGNSTGMLLLGMTKRIEIFNNIFDTPISSAYAITLHGSSVTTTSSFISIVNNKFIKSGSQTHSVYKANHTQLDSSTDRFYNNISDLYLTVLFDYNVTEFTFDISSLNEPYTSVMSILPDSLPLGDSWNIVNGDTSAPDANNQGVLRSFRPSISSGYRKFTVQYYSPANNSGTTLGDLYWRKAVDASNIWSAWIKVTGV